MDSRFVPPRRRREAGFTLAELAVTLIVMSQLIIAAALVFDFQNQVAKLQNETSELQQTARVSQLEVARYIRQAGRGGLLQQTPSLSQVNLGATVAVRNNVDSNTDRLVAVNTPDGPLAVRGSDILTIRGAFGSPIFLAEDNVSGTTFFVMRDDGGSVTRDSSEAVTGELHLCERSRNGWRQDLRQLRTAIDAAIQEAIVLQSTLRPDIYAVVALDPGNSNTSSAVCAAAGLGQGVQAAFDVSGGIADLYRQLSPVTGTDGMMPNITNIAFAAILEEHAFFVREEREIAGDDGSAFTPSFARLRLLPNTGLIHGDPTAALVDLGDNIMDFQVGMALDSTNGGAVEIATVPGNSPQILETDDGEDDDWLFNAAEDDATDPVWDRPLRPAAPDPATWRRARLYYLRLSMVGRTAQPEIRSDYLSPEIGDLEDREYDPSDTSGTDPDTLTQRRYLRRVVRASVDLRNLS